MSCFPSNFYFNLHSFHNRIKKSGLTVITTGFVIRPYMAIFEQWRNSFRTHGGFVEVSDLHTGGKFKRLERLKERQRKEHFRGDNYDLCFDNKDVSFQGP